MSSTGDLDLQIEQLMNCKPLSEEEVKALCEQIFIFSFSRKTLIYLVLTLYHMYPDYDFSAVKAHQFLTEESWDTFKQIFDTNMLEASKLLLLHSPISCSCGIYAGHEYNLKTSSASANTVPNIGRTKHRNDKIQGL
ncbi:hypothetical protein GOBAR_DD17466 [Gossypium barbadense]|nr:hypothetical protein GOBAR_DD17466 [Gossypium barbadense]